MSLVRKEELFPLSEPRSSYEPAGELLDLFSKGDERARDVFCDATKGLLFGILLHILNHTEIAESVLTKLYGELKRKAIRFNKQRDQPLTWLVLIVHRKGVERLCLELEVQATRRPSGEGKEFGSPRPFINISEQRRVIRGAMDMIPNSERRMLELAFFSGMSSVEIAEDLGLSRVAVEDGLLTATRHVFCVVRSLRFSQLGTQSQSSSEVFFQP
jgi:RNA polymerase sigma-70 factor (ECF subfamily)